MRWSVGLLFMCGLMWGCNAEPVPQEPGWYVVNKGTLRPLAKSTECSDAPAGLAVGSLSEITVTDSPTYFIVFENNRPSTIERIELSRLTEDRNLPIPVYRPHTAVPLNVFPMKDERMFKLVPREALTLGPYGLQLSELKGVNQAEIHDFFVVESIDGRSFEEWVQLLDAAKSSDWQTVIEAIARSGQDGIALLGRMLREGARDTRVIAADGLVRVGKGAVPVLVDSLKHSDPFVREQAAEALREMGMRHAPDAADAMSALLQAHTADENAAVRRTALDAMKSIDPQFASENKSDLDRQEDTVVTIRMIGDAARGYASNNHRYPAAVNVVELRRVLEPLYIQKLPIEDGWGNRLLAESDKQHFVITSSGRDGIRDETRRRGALPDVDNDIVFRDGIFETWPGKSANNPERSDDAAKEAK